MQFSMMSSEFFYLQSEHIPSKWEGYSPLVRRSANPKVR